MGTGGIAAAQTQDLLAAGHHVAAVGSRALDTANGFAQRFGISGRHGSYKDLAADPAVDIVYVATPHPMHVSGALTAIAAGKHVLVEKPFTVTAGQARKIVDAATQRGVFVMEAMWTRFLPSMERVMELVHGGAIGDPRVVIADHNQYIPRSKAARLHEPSLGGGALLDLGVYPVSLASSIFGTPSRVTARGTLTDQGVDELTAMIFEYHTGAQASLHTGFLTPGPNVATVVGTEGRIELDAVWYTQTAFRRFNRNGVVVEEYRETIPGRGMQFQAREVERCIHAGLLESERMSRSESVAIMETMDEVRRHIGVRYPDQEGAWGVAGAGDVAGAGRAGESYAARRVAGVRYGRGRRPAPFTRSRS